MRRIENLPLTLNLLSSILDPQFLNPDVILRITLTAHVTRIHDTAGLDNQDVTFVDCSGLVLHTFPNHKHLSRRKRYQSVSERDRHLAFHHDESLVGVHMLVPDKLPLNFHDLELVVVHLGDNSRRPMVRELAELLTEADSNPRTDFAARVVSLT